ncbi:hypothetical protein [uncultured Rhodoblastus sp.]|uniref:hypothetical protein n=1 Tax=uncultured Rhodoblastus sp. TaxID=543037 RepID=UPI0025D26639|nr:hypothetical protein [uncultured Rhodoblastus sp.]
MTTIITRLYAAEEHAVAAANALKERFRSEHINLVTRSSGQDPAAQVIKGGVHPSHAAIYADKIRQGHALVSVSAPWGFGKSALHALNSHGPVDSGIKNPDFHYTTASTRDPSPFSDLIKQTVLAKSKSSIKLPENKSLTSSFGFPTLSNSKSRTPLQDNAAPLSALAGLPTISRAKPFSSLVADDRSGVTLV